VPRVSRLLALALRLDRLVRAGAIADYATLARLGHVSRARVSQILSLALLAPDIQETLLFLPPTERGRDPIRLRQLQALAALPDWRHQRRLWQELASSLGGQNQPLSLSGSREPKGEMDKWISTVVNVEPGS
jgi:integrase